MNEGRDRSTGGSPCEEVRAVLPELVAASTDPATLSEGPGAVPWSSHLASCHACAAELTFLQRLANARPEPPAALAATIVAHALSQASSAPESGARTPDVDVLPFHRSARRPKPGPWWASSAAAAAVLVLAMGLGLVARGGPTGDAGSLESTEMLVAMEAELAMGGAEAWLVAGAPYLDAVSDETLAVLAAAVEP